VGPEKEDAAAENSSNASHLPRLPAELRNRIYGHVLAAGKRLEYIDSQSDGQGYFVIDGAKLFDMNDQKSAQQSEFNRIKYVCRQLYTETTGLELKHNKVQFNKSAFVSRNDGADRVKHSWLFSLRVHLQKLHGSWMSS
jgi:hypothetical protein